jgi:hypothetical protein
MTQVAEDSSSRGGPTASQAARTRDANRRASRSSTGVHTGSSAVSANVRVRAVAGREGQRPTGGREALSGEAQAGRERRGTGKVHDRARPQYPDERHDSAPAAARGVSASAAEVNVSGSPDRRSETLAARRRSGSAAINGAPQLAFEGRARRSSRSPTQARPAETKGKGKPADEPKGGVGRAPLGAPKATAGRVAAGRPLTAARLSRRSGTDRLSPRREQTPTRPRCEHEPACPRADEENAARPVRDAAAHSTHWGSGSGPKGAAELEARSPSHVNAMRDGRSQIEDPFALFVEFITLPPRIAVAFSAGAMGLHQRVLAGFLPSDAMPWEPMGLARRTAE